MRPSVRSLVMVALLGAGADVSPVGRDSVSLVPWKVVDPGAVVTEAPLVLFWIPASAEQLRRSALLASPDLTRFSARCVAMRVVRFNDYARLEALGVEGELPTAVLADRGGQVLASVEGEGGQLSLREVEDIVRDELEKRTEQAEVLLETARNHVADGDLQAGEAIYRSVLEDRCLFPRQGRAALKALQKLERSPN